MPYFIPLVRRLTIVNETAYEVSENPTALDLEGEPKAPDAPPRAADDLQEAPGLRPQGNPIDRVPSWAFPAAFAGLVLLFVVLSLINRKVFFDNFIDEYVWRPIVEDSGYNVVNTLLLMVVLGFVLGWIYRVVAELKERVDVGMTLAVVPYLVWGSMFRVLEDSDLFGPFNEDLARAGLKGGSSCAPAVGGTFLHQCTGVFLITPEIYVEVTLLAAFFLWLGHQARRLAHRKGLAWGLRLHAAAIAVLVIGLLALWAAAPSFLRLAPNPFVSILAGLVAFALIRWRARRTFSLNPRVAMFAYATIPLLLGAWYILVWMTGGRRGWAPQEGVHWWILVAMVAAPSLLVLVLARMARTLSVPGKDVDRLGPRLEKPNKPAALVAGLTVIAALFLFVSMTGAAGAEAALASGATWTSAGRLHHFLFLLMLGPFVLFAVDRWVGGLPKGRFGFHPFLAVFSHPVNLLIVGGQAVDAFTTSLGIDVFGYAPKQVIPRTLRGLIEGLNLPPPLDGYSTTLGMIPIKVLLALGVVWVMDASRRDEAARRETLIGLAKIAIIMVGVSPGVRDGIRLAMGT